MRQAESGLAADRSARAAALRWWLWRALAGLCLAGLGAFCIGLAQFAARLDQGEPRFVGEADGAVALTGGAERIADAVTLLARGHAGRLLISGVNQTTGSAEIARLAPQFTDLFACCIDLGHDAHNTRGNAQEARRWARGRGMRSLIVVTSAYHMPRALIEFSSALPEVELIPYPVVLERFKTSFWWADPQVARVLAFEYAKYLRSAARLRLMGPDEAPQGVTMTAGRG